MEINRNIIRVTLFSTMMLALSTIVRANNRVSLNSDGTAWKVFPDDGTSGETVSTASFQPVDAIAAQVPGTVFVDHVNAGNELNPDFGDNIYNVDESKYNRPFWYRTSFDRPTMTSSQRAILVFEGINRYADVYLNGSLLGRIEGHARLIRYDVTSKLASKDNVLSVRISLPREDLCPRDANYANYAMPSYVASHSWDWMPYVPGLNCGITNDVYLEVAGNVTVKNPWARSVLNDSYNSAYVVPTATLCNLGTGSRTVTLRAVVMPGNASVSQEVTLSEGEEKQITLSNMLINDPKLWWPNGNGEQNLYSCSFEVSEKGTVIDSHTVSFGIRKYEYRTENTALTLYVNGKKVFCKGGNWGMSHYLLQCKGDDYDTRIRLHKDMNCNMIRLWTGCVTDEEFYDACDKYGIMVWDDFWLTGPYTGLTGPDDQEEFMLNATDKVLRLRNHPSIAVWCGCNEGTPYDELNSLLTQLISDYDANDRLYQPNSHYGNGLSGSGWWTNFPPEDYFSTGIWGGGGDKGDVVDWGFRSELGMAVFTTYESFKEFMPEQYLWPRNEMWEKHFFSTQAQYGGGANADNYYNTVERNYGASTSIQEFCEKSQYVNIEVMKAMFEGWSYNLWDTASGLLFWMSQPAYPSLVWQTYDYYLEATGAYWGMKAACEPIHILWNCSNGDISIVNTSSERAEGLKAHIDVYDLNGEKYENFCSKHSDLLVDAASVSNIKRLSFVENLAQGKPCEASSVADNCPAANAVDGNTSTRWSSGYSDDNYITIDLQSVYSVSAFRLTWEYAYGKAYKIQVSTDGEQWTDAYVEQNGDGGEDYIELTEPVQARYVRMQGISRGTWYGYSLYEFEVFENPISESNVPDGMYFIRLRLDDMNGNAVSNNFYWKTTKGTKDDYSDLSTLPKADIGIETVSITQDENARKLTVNVSNSSSTTAFGIRLRLVDGSGNRILPVIMNDNYFTLFGGESKLITFEYTAKESDPLPQVMCKQYGQDEKQNVVNSISEPQKTSSRVEIYPNPVVDKLSVKSDKPLIATRLYSINGTEVMRSGSERVLNVGQLAPGIYILKVYFDDETRQIKIIKK